MLRPETVCLFVVAAQCRRVISAVVSGVGRVGYAAAAPRHCLRCAVFVRGGGRVGLRRATKSTASAMLC